MSLPGGPGHRTVFFAWILPGWICGCDYFFGDVIINELGRARQDGAAPGNSRADGVDAAGAPLASTDAGDASADGAASFDAGAPADAELAPDTGVRFDSGAGDVENPSAEQDSATPAAGCVPATRCDGFYSGSTAQERRVRFEIRGGGLASVVLEWEAPACSMIGSIGSVFSPPRMMESGSRVSSGFQDDPPVGYRLEGEIDASGSAEGTLSLTYFTEACEQQTVPFSWSATRAVCGNRRIEWPESCDDGNAQSGDGCSAGCQLAPAAEAEPNDTPATAEGPIEEDAVWFGSLPPGDLDYYEIRNPTMDAVTVDVSTHGLTMGTCGIDTELHFYNSDSISLGVVSGGAVGSCAADRRVIPANDLVRVAVFSEQAVAGYRLHVTYQVD